MRVDGTKDAVVGEGGEIVYAAVTDGFVTVDVSNPDDPRVLTERRELLSEDDAGPMELVWDTAVDGDRLAVAAPAYAAGNVPQGVLLYDVSDPADPVRVAFHETEAPVHNCDLDDGFLYLTGNDMRDNAAVVVDVRDDDPEEVSRFSPVDYDETWGELPPQTRVIHDVVVEGGIAYCPFWNAGTWLFDVSDPSDPEKRGIAGGYTAEAHIDLPTSQYRHSGLEPPGNHHYATPGDDGAIMAVNTESWRVDDSEYGGPGGITLWDVTDPTCPDHLSTIEPIYPVDATRGGIWTTAHNFELVGDRLYSSWYQDGVRIHDVSDPGNPVELTHWRDPDDASFWTARLARAGECFIAADHSVSDEGSPESDHVEGAGIYVFPDAAGEQIAQPEIPTREPPAEWSLEPPIEERATCSTPSTPTRTPSPPPSTPTRTPSPTPTDSPRPAADSPRPAADSTDEETPGFGLPGAIVALGGATYAAWRRTGE